MTTIGALVLAACGFLVVIAGSPIARPSPPFAETFSNDNHRFPSVDQPEVTADAVDGVYRVSANDDVANWQIADWEARLLQVGIQAEMTFPADSGTGLAVLSDTNDSMEESYDLRVWSDGTWAMTRHSTDPSTDAEELASGQDPMIRPDTTMTLALYAEHVGDVTDVWAWLGDRQLGHATDPDGFGDFNHAGLEFVTSSPPARFSADNVKVTIAPPQTPTADWMGGGSIDKRVAVLPPHAGRGEN